MRDMRSVAAFFAIIGLFVAMNAAFAATIVGVFKLGEWLWPEAMEQPLVLLVLGTGATVVVLWGFKVVTSPRRLKSRARDPA